MPEPKTDSSDRDRLLDLISAVAAGDAAHEDVVAELRNTGVDALDILVEVLAGATRKGQGRRISPQPLDPQQLSNSSPPKGAAKTVHRTPRRPFLLRGTLYDPADIERFNGTELHFVSTPGREELLALDDRAVMEHWWQLSYVSASLASSELKTLARNGGLIVTTDFGGGAGTPPGTGDFSLRPPAGSSGPEGFSMIPAPPPPVPHTNFYEDVNNGGSRIELPPNRGYKDLTEVSYTFFGTGDWNDTISSIELVATHVAALFEHVGFAGSSFTTTHNEPHLGGWNDVASSCSTW